MNAQPKTNQWGDSPPSTIPKVYAAISKVMAAIGKEGIAKGRENVQQHYKFRGIDDVYNALSTHLTEAGLLILPRVTGRTVSERESKSGGAIFSVILDMQYDFVAIEDGSTHTIAVAGEAMDSGDKATNKAMSAAFKYACMQAFCIPTEGDNDADATTHEIAAKAARKDFHDPRGDTSEVTTDRARELAMQMIAILELGVDEHIKALKVLDKHHELNKNAVEYIAAGMQMTPRQNSAWKAYKKMGDDAQKRPLNSPRG